MRVEILEEKLKSEDPETGHPYNLTAGDRVTVSDACGKRWCDRGWAMDLAEQDPYPTTERVVTGVQVTPKKAVLGITSPELGG